MRHHNSCLRWIHKNEKDITMSCKINVHVCKSTDNRYKKQQQKTASKWGSGENNKSSFCLQVRKCKSEADDKSWLTRASLKLHWSQKSTILKWLADVHTFTHSPTFAQTYSVFLVHHNKHDCQYIYFDSKKIFHVYLTNQNLYRDCKRFSLSSNLTRIIRFIWVSHKLQFMSEIHATRGIAETWMIIEDKLLLPLYPRTIIKLLNLIFV